MEEVVHETEHRQACARTGFYGHWTVFTFLADFRFLIPLWLFPMLERMKNMLIFGKGNLA